MLTRLVIFLVLNFVALGIGGLFTTPGVDSEWYGSLAKAPWTPPGWLFGFAWTTIMICLAFFMAYAWDEVQNKKTLIVLYGVQLVLNVVWNPIFFYFRQVQLGMLMIWLLTCIVAYMLVHYRSTLGDKSLLLLPYVIWLFIATSLNAYIMLKN